MRKSCGASILPQSADCVVFSNLDVMVQWSNAHSLLLEEVSADTLAILDTCYASNTTKGALSSGRTYQLLAASGWNKVTAGPGIRSFTAALIESLHECLQGGRPFSVWGLMSKINKKVYRRANPAQLHDILGTHSRQILLAPLDRSKKEREKRLQTIIDSSGIADLVLRFVLGVKDMSKFHVEELTKRLPRVVHDTGLDLCRIDLDGFIMSERHSTADLVLRFGLDVMDLSKHHIGDLTKRLPKVFHDIGLDLRQIKLEGFQRMDRVSPVLLDVAKTMYYAMHYGKRWLEITRRNGESTDPEENQPAIEDDDLD